MILPRALVICLFASAALFAAAPAAHGWSRDQAAGYTADRERAWAALTNPATGAVADKIAPGPHAVRDFNYGTFMLADAQLRTARRTGDRELAARAVAIVNGTIARNGGNAPSDPFNLLAGASLIADGRADRFPTDAWAQIQAPLEDMATKFPPFTGHGFTDPDVFDNWRLVWSAGAVQLANAGLPGRPGSISENLVALRSEVARIVGQLVPRNGGPVITTPYGPGRALSDRPDQPLAYHLFCAVLLERIYEADPSLFNPAALQVREQMGNYALTLMAPDGDLTPSGRSIQQSWVLGAAADLGAMRANHGGPDAPRWRAFAERALDRLARVHGTFADGTIPVIPGLLLTADQRIADHYSSMSQYNGLTLFFLQHAADQWPEQVPVGRLAADGDFLASDLGDGGPALTWGRAGDAWWAIQGRRTRSDSRATQGIVALKVRTKAGWRDKIATRPLASTPTDWILQTRRGKAHLELTRASGTSRHAVITGHWMIGRKTYRAAQWHVRVKGTRLLVSTEPLRKQERLNAVVWESAPRSGRRAHAAAVTVCKTSASGPACAHRLQWARAGNVELRLD